MKKLISLFLSMAVILSFAGCQDKEEGPHLKEDVSINDVVNAAEESMKETYGDEYIIGIPVDETFLEDTLLIDMKDVSKFAGFVSDSMVRNDTCIVIKAKTGRQEAIKEAFDALKETYIERFKDYQVEGSLERAENSEIIVKGNYVIYLAVGNLDAETGKSNFEDDMKNAKAAVDSLFTE